MSRFQPVDERDARVVELWIRKQKSADTRRNYRRYAREFFEHVRKPLLTIGLDDLLMFAAHVSTLQLNAGSQQRYISAVKSLFTFCAKLKYLPFDTAAPLDLPDAPDTLAARILEAEDVKRLIEAADTPRNRLLMYLLYSAGLRRRELASLRWSNMQPRRNGGQVTVLMGKGGKTRTIHLQPNIWDGLASTRHAAVATAALFVSRLGRPISASQIYRVVKKAASRAGLDPSVSPHWLRHCNASHALDGGSPLHVVQQTLGHANIATTSKYLHVRPNESSGKYLPPI